MSDYSNNSQNDYNYGEEEPEGYISPYTDDWIYLGYGVTLICQTYPDGRMQVGWTIRQPNGGRRFRWPR